jgi:hypothetical protein
MKYSGFLLVLLLAACTGSLSDDQRKRIKESMEQGEIKKVSEAQITESAFTYGRNLASVVEKQDKELMNQAFLDSLSRAYQVEILFLQPENNNLRNVERQVMEAYSESNESYDNIQKMGTDSLLYTKPILSENPDGSTKFLKALGIRMTRKQIVLSIKD